MMNLYEVVNTLLGTYINVSSSTLKWTACKLQMYFSRMYLVPLKRKLFNVKLFGIHLATQQCQLIFLIFWLPFHSSNDLSTVLYKLKEFSY